MDYKDYKLEIKSQNETEDVLTFEGIASPFDGKADTGGDVIHSGSFSRTLEQKGTSRILLFNHDPNQPIGSVELVETKSGLEVVKGEIELGIQRGREIALLVKKKIMKGMSIGYKSVKGKIEYKNNERHLREINLYELTLTPFPMNTRANVTSFKSMDFEGILNHCDDMISECKERKLTELEFKKANETIRELNALLMRQDSFDSSFVETQEKKIEADKLGEMLDKLNNFYSKGF